MPGRDRTGPTGAGAMTGRARGLCAGVTTPGNANPAGGRNFGAGGGGGRGARGGGRGWRNIFRATGLFGWQRAATPGVDSPDRDRQQDALKAQAGVVEKTLEDLKAQIETVKTASAEK